MVQQERYKIFKGRVLGSKKVQTIKFERIPKSYFHHSRAGFRFPSGSKIQCTFYMNRIYIETKGFPPFLQLLCHYTKVRFSNTSS